MTDVKCVVGGTWSLEIGRRDVLGLDRHRVMMPVRLEGRRARRGDEDQAMETGEAGTEWKRSGRGLRKQRDNDADTWLAHLVPLADRSMFRYVRAPLTLL